MDYVDPVVGGTVWILGAGFSRGLGGPLFRDLFRSDQRIHASGVKLPKSAIDLMGLYRKYADQETAASVGVLWRDPEEFIEVLESAKAPGRARDLLNVQSPGTPDELADLARRLLAVECSQFLRGANPESERWQPYQTWSSDLNKTHTVVSFNYDRVIEMLGNRHATKFYSVVVPTDEVALSRVRHMGCAPVLKLHGSVDWVTRNGRVEQDTSDDLPATAVSGTDIVIAVPGPEKGEFGRRFKEIGSLWRAALEATKNAGRIVFLGYRFPVTDAFARVQFLNAIKFAAKGQRLKRVEIVLGPDERHPDVARMQRLLSFALGHALVPTVHPLYVEDFLSFSHDRVGAEPPADWTD